MSAHNQFAPEVDAMRTTIANYGGPTKYRNACGRPDSYKAQALVELASRLYLEDELERARREHAALVDRLEAAEQRADLAERGAVAAPPA